MSTLQNCSLRLQSLISFVKILWGLCTFTDYDAFLHLICLVSERHLDLRNPMNRVFPILIFSMNLQNITKRKICCIFHGSAIGFNYILSKHTVVAFNSVTKRKHHNIAENTFYVLCNFSFVEFSEFKIKIQIEKLICLWKPLRDTKTAVKIGINLHWNTNHAFAFHLIDESATMNDHTGWASKLSAKVEWVAGGGGGMMIGIISLI